MIKKFFSNKKEIEDMTKEEVIKFIGETTELIEQNNKEIQKLMKRISNLKKDNKGKEKDIKRGNSRLEILELREYKKLEEKTIFLNKKIDEPVKDPTSSLEIYLCFKKIDEQNNEVYAVSSENELITKEITPIKYENISVTVRELCCFIQYLKNLNALQKQEELKIVKVSKLYVDNLFIVNNWTNGIVKENQNKVIQELIPVATALRKEFEELGGELIYIKPKENTAKIYYKENIEE